MNFIDKNLKEILFFGWNFTGRWLNLIYDMYFINFTKGILENKIWRGVKLLYGMYFIKFL